MSSDSNNIANNPPISPAIPASKPPEASQVETPSIQSPSSGIFPGRTLTPLTGNKGISANKDITMPSPSQLVATVQPKSVDKPVAPAPNAVAPGIAQSILAGHTVAPAAKATEADQKDAFPNIKNFIDTLNALAGKSGYFLIKNKADGSYEITEDANHPDILSPKEIALDAQKCLKHIQKKFQVAKSGLDQLKVQLDCFQLKVGMKVFDSEGDQPELKQFADDWDQAAKMMEAEREIAFPSAARVNVSGTGADKNLTELQEHRDLLNWIAEAEGDLMVDLVDSPHFGAVSEMFFETQELLKANSAEMQDVQAIRQLRNERTMALFHAQIDPMNVGGGTFGSLNLRVTSEALIKDMHANQGPALKNFGNATKELEFAQEIGLEVGNVREQNQIHQLPVITDKVMAAINALPDPPVDPRHCVVLQGGYINSEKGGHAVMYQIEREVGGKFKFTVFNTGEGGKSVLIKGNMRQENVVYTGLTADKLKGCVGKLLECKAPATAFPLKLNMDKVNDIIDDHLLQRNANATTNKGVDGTSRQQKQGTCAMRSPLAWLHKRIGAEEYRQFRPQSMRRFRDASQAEFNRFKDNHTWQMVNFGTTDPKIINTIRDRLFAEANANIQKLERHNKISGGAT